LVSAASAWEIAIKYRNGKLPDGAEALNRFGELVAADGFTHLQIKNATLISIDPAFKAFRTKILW
jgi:PIN domain nuclease of toxin-antitoxin system